MTISVSRETQSLLNEYIELILLWNNKINLISRKSISKPFLEAQVRDSMQIISMIDDLSGQLIDIGSGSGLPAIVLNILGVANCSLVEINKKKASFLLHAKTKLLLSYEVQNMSIEAYNPLTPIKYITSKAYGTLDLMLSQSERLINEETSLITLKSGTQLKDELEKVSQSWDFELKSIENQYSNGYIIKLSNLKKRING